ncbi:hypothetical protein [Roseicyclus mahoneyensis]|uniref:Uncharacterized protein n=1 Tax=Roseicyclus mahoneyensis TaxID=164332 RepID=A0A316GR36_9RHOB|nr:hypothetical protein [Roseicyclus mahoneyensis]PWK62871.1 hypothetical protein C7455_101910 [Roseicyclus mahoneyensis]
MIRRVGAILAGGVMLAVVTGVVTGAAAQGICPTGVARDGVWFDFPDRSVLTRVLSDGRVEEIEFGHDGSYMYVYRALPIGLVVESWSIENGYAPRNEEETVSFLGTPNPVPDPMAGVRYDGISTLRFGDGSESRATVNVVVGEARTVDIGGCSYTAHDVAVTRVDLDGGLPQNDAMLFLPDLAVTLFLGFSEGDVPPEDALPLSVSLTPPRPPGEAGGGLGAGAGVLPPPLPQLGGGAEQK